jgi:NADPH:quinone reductase-like Zn-dependent oxidoreductase
MRHFGADLGTSLDGWMAEYVKVPAAALVKIPAAITDEQAAPLAAATLTAWHAVVEVGQVRAGDLVVALGTGGVAMAALQIAKANGAFVAITSSSDEKLEQARKLGADYTVNYATHPDWAAELQRQTGGRGADIVVETGGQHTLPQSINACAVNARIVIIGVGAADGPLPNYGGIIGKNITLKGIAEGSRAMLARLVRAIEANGFAPVVDRVFGFDEAQDACRYLKSGSHIGKVLIKVD